MPKSSAASVTQAIITTINSGVGMAWRNNTVGVFDPARKIYRRSADRSAIGTADVIACIAGKYWEIEVKAGKDRQSEGQREHEKRVAAAGGSYIIVRTIDEFINYAHEFGWIAAH